MGFILDGLDTEAYDREYSDVELVRRIISYFQPHTRQMIVVAIMIALNSVAGSGGPILVAEAIDVVARDASTRNMLLLVGGVLVLGAAAWTINYVRQMVSSRVVGDVVLQLRKDVFDATIGHDLSFFDEHPSGKIVSRVTSDTQDFAEVVNLTVNLLSQVLLVVVLSIWLFRVNVWLTLLLLGMTPFAVAVALSFRRVARRVTQRARRVTARINAQIQESISGIVVAKSFRQERGIYADFAAINKQAYQMGLRRGLTINTIFPIMGCASGLGVATLVYAGSLATRGGAVSPGNWYLFMQAVGFYWWPLINIASFWSQFQDGLSASERVFALIDADPRVVQVADEPVEALEGRITFRNLGFSYTERVVQRTGADPSNPSEPAPTDGEEGETGPRRAGTRPAPTDGDGGSGAWSYAMGETVLPDFTLEIRPRETVALVGHTGAGKSSVARLIARFYEFQDGELLIDGRDIRRLDLAQYRHHIGIVPQEPFLFSGTVADNIRYGRPRATEDRVRQAATQISSGDWLADLPAGLDTDVGERGSNLSMGQRQLVALARVLLKEPTIFILDEATASVDPFTEAQIQEGLETIMRASTAIVIAHRLSTVKHADRIIVMDHGQIIEEGTHNSLMAQGGHYAELYNTYFRHQSIEYVEGFGRGEGEEGG